MKIVIIGIRGIPSNYGGFETCVEELSKRLSVKYEVIVYARSQYYKYDKLAYYNGCKIVYLPTIKLKFIDTLFHTSISIFHALIFYKKSYWFIFNAANSPALLLPALLRQKMALNTDGLEWKRDKWGSIGKLYYQFAEWLSTKLVNDIITDSKGMHNYYKKRWKKKSSIIEYGAYIQKSKNCTVINKYGLGKDNYFLQITRLEPENNPLLTIEAFIHFKDNNPDSMLKLVIVGDVSYQSEYSKKIKITKREDIIFTGFEYDKKILCELRTNCFAYIHGNQVGGTNPALLEAMGAGVFIIARDVNFNREVLGNGGLFFMRNKLDLCKKMEWVLKNKNTRKEYIEKSLEKVEKYYNWDRITSEYEKLAKGK